MSHFYSDFFIFIFYNFLCVYGKFVYILKKDFWVAKYLRYFPRNFIRERHFHVKI